MKKLGIYIIISIITILFRDNIAFFFGNVLNTFKLDNNYEESIINLQKEEINYLKEEINKLNEFSKNLYKINYNYIVSKIIYKNSYNTSKYTIQYGSNNDITIGLGVINEYGLVGKITDINDNTSELTTLKELKDISVLVNGNVGKMNYDYNEERFIVSDISNYDKVNINDEVFTSGYGTIKEKLLIGKVEKIVNNTYSKKIYLKSEVDFNNLNYLLIVGDIE